MIHVFVKIKFKFIIGLYSSVISYVKYVVFVGSFNDIKFNLIKENSLI